MNQPIFIQILNEVKVNSRGCWLWTGRRQNPGEGGHYGLLRGKRLVLAHRAAYIEFKGPIADGLFVCHTCDIKLCVNPDHLWLGTQKENMQDCADKGRDRSGQKTVCLRGHEFTLKNQWKNPQRICVTCRRESQRERRAS